MPTVMPITSSASTPGRPHFGGARALAALALCAAAGAHGAQAARHLPDGSFHGQLHAAFFGAAAAFQIVAAGRVLARPGRRVASVTAIVSLGLAVVWALAVTVGLPGWLAPAPEPLTLAGGMAAALEVFAASVLATSVVSLPRRPQDIFPAKPVSEGRRSASVAVAAAVFVATGWALPISASAHRHTDGEHGAGEHGGIQVEGVHLHGLGGDAPDPGPDPARQARSPLAGTRLPAGLQPAAVAVEGTTVWVADREAGVVHRLDAASGRPLGPPTVVGIHPAGIAVGAGGVWVTNAGSDSVTRLDESTGDNVATIAVGSVPVGVAVGAGGVWVANSAEGTVSRIDPASAEVRTTARIGYGPTAITFAAGRPWVVAALDRAVVSLDPDTVTVVTETPVDAGPTSIAFGHGSIWVASSSAGTIVRIDPVTGERVGSPVVTDRRAQPGQGPAAVAVGEKVWVLNNHDKTVVTIDPATHAVSTPRFIDRHIARSITPASLAMSDAGELWATEGESGAVVRLQIPKDV